MIVITTIIIIMIISAENNLLGTNTGDYGGQSTSTLQQVKSLQLVQDRIMTIKKNAALVNIAKTVRNTYYFFAFGGQPCIASPWN